MHVLGIAGRSRYGAAAIASGGRLVAAVTEAGIARVEDVGYAHTSGLPFGAVGACLTRAGLSPGDIDLVMIEGAGESEVDATRARWSAENADPLLQPIAGRPHRAVDSLTARAAQALPMLGRDRSGIVVLDLEGAGHGGIFQASGGRLGPARAIGGVNGLVGAVSQVARSLGCRNGQPTSLSALAETGAPDYLDALRRAMAYRGGAIDVSAAGLTAAIEQAAGEAPGALSDPSAVHVKVRAVRAGLAASLVARLAEIASEVVADADAGRVIASGSLFEPASIAAAVRARCAALRIAPLPGPFGVALGAALLGSGDIATSLPDGLALGPSFSEPEVKEVLDGCRLDYVYEPDAWRIDARISPMLSRGKLVAWFQGPMDFGPRSLGARSILADPSNRYARENINRYLRHRPDDQPPPLVMLEDRTGECLTDRVSSPLGLTRATVQEGWRPRLQAGVSPAGACRVHTVVRGSGRLAALLAAHEQLSGAPALVHVDLRGLDEPTACSPRDAIRTTFSSPVDALVIERFLLMKDYWLLRSTPE